MADYCKPTSSGILLFIHLQPRSSRNELAGIHGDRLKVRLTAPPVDSKANEALCEFLAEKLGVPKSSVQLVRGEKSRKKDVLVSGLSAKQVTGKLGDWQSRVMPLTWEKFQSSDTEDLLRLMEGFVRVAHLPWDAARRRQNMAEFTQGDIWLIVLDGKKIGYAVSVIGFSFEFGGRIAFIDEFYVEEGHRGKGVGGRTLDFIARHEAQQGSVVLLLEASDLESRLHDFYGKSGFVRRDYRLYFRKL